MTIKECGEYLKNNPSDEDILMMRARLLTRVDRNAEASADVAHALLLRPQDARALAVRGYCNIVAHRYAAAISDFEKAVALEKPDPLCAESVVKYANLAELYRITGQMEKRKKALLVAANQKIFQDARELRASGALDSTIKMLNRILAADKTDFYSRLLRAVCYGNQTEYGKAIEDWSELIKQFPACAELYYFRADCYSEIGSKAKAVADLKKVIELKPRIVAFNFIAQSGRIREAFEPIDEKVVNLADINYLLGRLYEDLDDLPSAKKAFDRCLALDPRVARARLDRALIARKQLDGKAALMDLNEAIKASPRFVDAYLERAKLQEQLANNQAALADYGLVISFNANEFGPYLLRGELYSRLKDYRAALADLDKAISLAPTESDLYIARGDTLARAQRPDKALADYKMALKLSPSDRTIIQDKINRIGMRADFSH